MTTFVHHADSAYKARQKLQSLGMGGGEARSCVNSAMKNGKHNCGVIPQVGRVIVKHKGDEKFEIEVLK